MAPQTELCNIVCLLICEITTLLKSEQRSPLRNFDEKWQFKDHHGDDNVLVVVMMMVVVVGGGLVKICVNVACWEKVIGREKLPRAQRILQARGLTPDFQKAPSSSSLSPPSSQ